MMTSRVLPREEWGRLEGTDLGAVCHLLPATTTEIVVVEEDGQIIGCWGAFTVLHAEGVWIHPEHRGKGSVARRLWAGMRRIAERVGVTGVITGAADDSVQALLEHHAAVRLPQEYCLSLKGRV